MKQLFGSLVVVCSFVIAAGASGQANCGGCPSGPYVNFYAYLPGGNISGPVSIYVGPGSTPTLSMVMNNAACAFSGFTYSGAEFCPYGEFLSTINGVSPPSGSYWELFINGSPASCGLDSCTVAPNDTIVWMIASSGVDSETVSFQRKLHGLQQKRKASK